MTSTTLSDFWDRDVVKFWFEELSPKHWFVRDERVDRDIADRFSDLYESLSCQLPPLCRTSPQAALAAIIVLDQFSRNLFRGSAKSFVMDERALELAGDAISRGLDKKLSDEQRQFIYMPFMHSEDPLVQVRSIELFTALGNENNLKFAISHKDIIYRFGRFPHRNEILRRTSTSDEVEFLQQPGSSF